MGFAGRGAKRRRPHKPPLRVGVGSNPLVAMIVGYRLKRLL
jgi:hypothetical protein